MTAQQQYTANLAQIEELTIKLKAAINAHSEDFVNHSDNWGYANDLGRVVQHLSELVNYFE